MAVIWNDLREYLERLERDGNLTIVRGARWEDEIGTITELMDERDGPALLFDEIPGYPKGFRILANAIENYDSMSMAMGLDPKMSTEERSERWGQITKSFKSCPPQEMSTGPVLENMITGDAVDLFRFPTPRWHEADGGRYIGTGVCVIQKDPETDFVNVGCYRVSVQDERTCGIFMEPGRHGDVIRKKFWARGEACPVVVCVGQEPVLTVLSGSSMFRSPDQVSELEVAGHVHDAPYPVIKAPITGLPIPAAAEIAIEGFIPPPSEGLMDEGPFGEWTGYYGHVRHPETIINVKAIYHRNDPVIFASPPERPVNATVELGKNNVQTRRRMEEAGIKGVRGVYTLANPGFMVVSLKQMHAGHVEEVSKFVSPEGDRFSGNQIWVIVDDDITTAAEVLWAMATRLIPETGVRVVPGRAIWQLDPRILPEYRAAALHGEKGPYPAHNLVINACRPYDWIDQFPPVNMNSPELRARVLRDWESLFN
ncbi:MAG: UbiD family decarboxylase [Chloroflexi bacterium]|nr:UbiD family decarboxylase [Chloroflexota bacterium]